MSRVYVSTVVEDMLVDDRGRIVSQTLALKILEGAIQRMYAVFNSRFYFLPFEENIVCLRQLAMSRFFMACLWLTWRDSSHKKAQRLMRVCAHVRRNYIDVLSKRRVAVDIRSTPDVWWFRDENGVVDLGVGVRSLGDCVLSHQRAYKEELYILS